MFRLTRRPLPRLLLSLLFALGLLIGGLTTPVLAASRLPAVSLTCNGVGPCAGTPATLLIHGVADNDHVSGGCDGNNTFGNVISFLQRAGWTNVYSVAYYKNDWDCGPNPNPNSSQPETTPQGNLYSFEQTYQFCTSYNDSGSADGTSDEDGRHVACELAWYIWEYYTSSNNAVNIVAHSLGGVLLKEALYQIYVKHNAVFPPYLYIHQVVTFESPLDGVQIGSDLACGGCFQVAQLQQGNPFGYWGDLTDPPSRTVQASGGTNWTMEGDADSKCSTLGYAVGGSAFGMDYGLKISYNQYVPGLNGSMPDACSDNGGKNYYYGHGTYLVDTQTATNVPAKYCVNCAGEHPGNSGTFSHSLQEMVWGINGRCSVGLGSTATCDGTDPVVTGCNSTRYAQSGDVWYLTIYWSTHCSTNWAVVSAPSGYLAKVTVVRSPTGSWSNIDRSLIYCAPSRIPCPVGTRQIFGGYTTSWYTDMLYAPNEKVAVQIYTTTGSTYTSIWH